MMHLEQGHLYHIFNQGNNKQQIFFKRENYLFFLSKIKEYILPHSNIVAWCLMPNHFHLMVEVKEVTIEFAKNGAKSSDGVTQSHPVTNCPITHRTLNESIGIMLRSYTRAINKQQNRTGGLFREETKAECISKASNITPSFYNTEFGASMHTNHPEEEYPQVCFNYIHLNPVKACLVNVAEKWEFSSYRDYCGLRNGKLVDNDCAQRFGISAASVVGARFQVALPLLHRRLKVNRDSLSEREAISNKIIQYTAQPHVAQEP